MYIALVFSIIFIVTFFIVLLTRMKFEVALPLTFASIIILGYILGLFGLLKYLTIIYPIITAVCLVFGIILFLKSKSKKDIIFKKLVTPGFVVFLILLMVTYFSTKGRLLAGWDEFSHWGLVAKNMFFMDNLGNAPQATTYFKDYPPGIAIIQYFFTKFNSVFIEYFLFLAVILFSYAVMLPVCKNITWSKWKYIPLYCFFIYALPLVFFPLFHQAIYVDTILGLIFGAILYLYFSSKELNVYLIIQLSMLSFVLCIIKEAGAGMAVIAWLIIVFDYLRNFRKQIAVKRSINYLYIAIPLLCILLSKFSWDIYLNSLHITKIWDTSGITLDKVFGLFGPNIPAYQETTLKNFFGGLLNPLDYVLRLSYFLWCITLVITTRFISRKCQDEIQRKRINLAGVLMLIGFFVYSLYLLLLYLFTYTQYEAQSLASFARYLNTYMIGFLVFVFYLGQDTLFNTYSSQPSNKFGLKMLVISAVLMVFMPMWRIPTTTFLAGFEIKSTQVLRESYSGILNYTSSMNKDVDKIYIIAQNTNGYDYWVLRYNATPIRVNDTCTWSLGEPYSAEDIWTKNLSLKEWEQELEADYTYVYLFSIDERFINDYGVIFDEGVPILNGNIYYINKSGDEIKLCLPANDT